MPVEIETTGIPDVLVLKPRVFGDDRGFFMEAWNQVDFDGALGDHIEFVQDNHSRSVRNVLRGLHYQLDTPQGKLVRVASGSIFDVAVDIRRGSAHFGGWVAAELSAANKHQLWIPPGFAHGFLVLSDAADVLYKATTYYAPASDRSILWSDPAIGVEWPIGPGVEPLLSVKDRDAVPLAAAQVL